MLTQLLSTTTLMHDYTNRWEITSTDFDKIPEIVVLIPLCELILPQYQLHLSPLDWLLLYQSNARAELAHEFQFPQYLINVINDDVILSICNCDTESELQSFKYYQSELINGPSAWSRN
jgi:hypothetical protein